jgi:hypothetical protein
MPQLTEAWPPDLIHGRSKSDQAGQIWTGGGHSRTVGPTDRWAALDSSSLTLIGRTLLPLVVHVVEVIRVLLASRGPAQIAVWGWQMAGPAHSLGEFAVC